MGHVTTHLPDTAVFGGMIRDFNLNHARKFKSDIDIVSVASANEIYQLIKPYSPVKNKFGGFRFCIYDRLFDIWSLEDTWAIKQGFVSGSQLADLCSTTFFTLDSAIFTLNNKQVITSKKYRQHVQQRILSINLPQHPSYQSMAVRAVRMTLKNNLAMDPGLCEFVMTYFPPLAILAAYMNNSLKI